MLGDATLTTMSVRGCIQQDPGTHVPKGGEIRDRRLSDRNRGLDQGRAISAFERKDSAPEPDLVVELAKGDYLMIHPCVCWGMVLIL